MATAIVTGNVGTVLTSRFGRTLLSLTLFFLLAISATAQTVGFSATRGFYDAPFALTLTGPAGETIRYTTDGTLPTATNGLVYTGPITISTTAVIRAASFGAGTSTTPVTHSYFFANDIIRQPATIPGWPNNDYEIVGGVTGNVREHDYAMDPNIVNDPQYSTELVTGLKEIPTISVVMNKADFWSMNDGSAAEFPASVEIIYPNNPSQNEHFLCGIEGHSHIRLKRSFRLVVSNTYFPTGLTSNIFKNAPLNGSFAKTNFTRGKIILRAGNDRSWASPVYTNRTVYARDEWYRQSQIDISAAGSPGTFMHLYVNGIYWGLYNPVQRPDAGYSAQYFGGAYADWLSVEPDGIRSGDPTRFNYLKGALTDKDMSVPANYAELRQYLDVNNFADYLLLTWYTGMSDWPNNNFQGANRNTPTTTPHVYYGWDAEFSWDDDAYGIDVNNGAWVHPDFRNGAGITGDMNKIWHSARENSDFMMSFADRVYKHCFNDGKLTDAASRQRWQTLTNFLNKAIIAESAKWGDAIGDGTTRTRNQHWLPEVARVDALMNGNVSRFITALRQQGYYPSVDPPSFSLPGGITAAGSTLTITNPGGTGTIYYTLDGTDPRASGGAIAATALPYSGTAIPLGGNLVVKARVLNGTSWSALQEAAYFTPTLRINEFMAANSSTIQDEGGVYEDWIEIYNDGDFPINIGGMYITDNLSNLTLYQIPATNPTETTIPAKGFILLWADNEPAQGVRHVGLKLSTGGEAIGLSYLSNGVPVLLDSYTFGIQTADVSTGRFPDGGPDFITFISPTPGLSNLESKTKGLYINEVVSENTSGITDENGNFASWIEIYNKNNKAINIGGMYLSNDGANPLLFQVPNTNPALTTIPANGFIRLWADNQASLGVLHLGFTLAPTAGTISLTERTGTTNNIIDNLAYTANTANQSTGRYPDGSTNLKIFSSPTPLAANTLPLVTGLLINEFLASNGTSQTDEFGEHDDWFEIYNSSDVPVDVGGLFVTDNSANPVKWQIPTNNPALTTIPAKGFLLLWADEQTSQGALHTNIKLSASGEQVGLYQVNGTQTTLIDLITFGAQVTDVSQGRFPDGDPVISILAAPTPGLTNNTIPVNKVPIANAGTDGSIRLPVNTFTLNGSGTDEDGSVTGYAWTQLAGPNTAVFSNVAIANPLVSGLAEGQYRFNLIVTDNKGAQSLADEIVLDVLPSLNTPPTANAGGDITINVPAVSTALNGSGLDTEAPIKSYAWTQVSGPNTAVFSSTTIPAPTVSGLAEGVYVFRLTVTDAEDLTGTDDVTVTVGPALVYTIGGYAFETGFDGWTPASTATNSNSKRIVNATFAYEGSASLLVQSRGNTSFVTSPQLNLTGYRSVTVRFYFRAISMESAEDFWLQYSSNNGSTWTRIATLVAGTQFANDQFYVATVTMNSGTFNTTGRFRFRNDAGDATDQVYLDSVTISAKLTNNGTTTTLAVSQVNKNNQRPTANAGTDQAITLPTSTITLAGSGTDPDGTIAGYSWSQVSGPGTAVFSSTSVASPQVSGLLAGTYVFRLIVSDNQAAQSDADEVSITVNPDQSAPQVTATNPTANATNVAPNALIAVTFNESLLATSVQTPNVQLLQGLTPVPATVSYITATNTIQITPTATLGAETLYTVVLKGGTGGVSDLAGNTLSNDFSFAFTTRAIDNIAPVSSILSPAQGASISQGVPQVISGTASDAGGLARVDVSVNGGQSWLTATGTSNWSLSWTPTATGPVSILSRATDLSGNPETPGTVPSANAISVTVTAPPNPCPCTIYTTQLPTIANQRDNTTGIVVGTRFSSSQNGFITGLRFYKGVGNTGTHIGQLWTSTGTLLAQATYTNETASGWQVVNLATPVAITAGTTYIVSYHSSQGYYSTTANQFATSIVNGPLTAPADVAGARNGLYVYSATPVFPTLDYLKEGYFTDVIFNSIIAPDLTAPTVSSVTPVAGATGVALNATATAVFSEALDPATVNSTNAYILAGVTPVSASVSFNSTTRTLTLVPNASLLSNTSYTVVLKGGPSGLKDLSSNPLAADYTWGFTTVNVAADLTPPVSIISSPLHNASVTVGQPISITGTASDNTGLTRVEVSVNGGVSWQTATGTANWSLAWTPPSTGGYTILSRGIDLAGNVEVPGTVPSADAISVNATTAVNPCPCTIYTTQVPTIANQRDNTIGMVVGTRFTSSQNGYITALRFYKGVGNTGTHIGQLWTSTGTLLAQATYTNETASGWQVVNLATPVAITAGTTYIVSYHSSQGYYSVTANQFATSIVNGPLTAPADVSGARNGLYIYSSTPAFPTLDYLKEGYFVDVVFNTVIPAGPSILSGNDMLDQPANQGALATGSLAYRLWQNYPNPSNGKTMIRYVLPAREQIRLSLYDLQGRLIRVLVNDVQNAGEHAYELDTKPLTKGVYLYRMEAGKFVRTMRLMVE